MNIYFDWGEEFSNYFYTKFQGHVIPYIEFYCHEHYLKKEELLAKACKYFHYLGISLAFSVVLKFITIFTFLYYLVFHQKK